MAVTSQRFFSDFYDSVHQRSYPTISDKLGKELGEKLFLGRLRLDSFLSKSLVLVDTQLLDGELFIDLDPTKLAKRLAREEDGPIPIEIRSRERTLEESLLAFFRQPGKDKLIPFAISLVRDNETRTAVMERLGATDSENLRSIHNILAILREAEVDGGDVERIEQGWIRWFEAERNGLVELHQWEGNWDLDISLGGINAIRSCLQTESGRDLAVWTWENRQSRSVIDAKLNDVSVQCTNDSALKDVLRIWMWFNSGYNRTISHQHGCDTFESVGVSPAFVKEFDEGNCDYEALQCLSLKVPEGFLPRLGSMPSSKLQEFYWRHGNDLKTWWETGDTDAFQKAVDALATACSEVEPASPSLASRLAIASSGAFVGGVIGTGGGPLGQLVGAVLGAMTQEAFLWFSENYSARPLARTTQRIVEIGKERAK